MNIVLAYLSGRPDRSDPYISLLPVGLCSLQACLRRRGKNAILANYSGWSEQAIISHLKSTKPRVVGLSIWTHNRHASLALARHIRSEFPETCIIAGGAHASFQYDRLLQLDASPFDAVILGEGEATLQELVDCIETGIKSWHDVPGIAYRSSNGDVVVTQSRQFISDLDVLPFTSLYLECSVGVDIPLQAEFLLSSRGCPSACTFCSSPSFWTRRVRFRSPESMVEELLFIREQYGLIYYSFRDDTFTVDRDRTIRFCQLLIERKLYILWNCQSRVNVLDRELLSWMKRAGCECVQLGVESGSPRILKQLGKSITPQQVKAASVLIKDAGINLSIYLISDVPGETEDDLQLTFQLLRAIQPDDGYVSPLAYFPGTRLFEENIGAGVVLDNLFDSTLDEALFVTGKTAHTKRIIKALARNRSGKNINKYHKHKQDFGYCYTTNVLAADLFRQAGYYQLAEAECMEICNKEPDNPWGWLLLAELYEVMENISEAQKMYAIVSGLVPRHKQTLDALAAFSS